MKQVIKDSVDRNIMSEIFVENGNFKLEGFDPYHYAAQSQEGNLIYDLLFKEDGNVQYNVIKEAIDFATKHNCLWNSDIAKYIICERISDITKGNYTDVSLWR